MVEVVTRSDEVDQKLVEPVTRSHVADQAEVEAPCPSCSPPPPRTMSHNRSFPVVRLPWS